MAGLVGGLGGCAPRTPYENFRKFAKNSLRKLQKCRILAYFAKKFQNPALNFRWFRRKTQLVEEILRKFWNFLTKIQLKNWIFVYFWEKFVAKSRAFGNNIIFLQQFFRLGGLNPLTPLRMPLARAPPPPKKSWRRLWIIRISKLC